MMNVAAANVKNISQLIASSPCIPASNCKICMTMLAAKDLFLALQPARPTNVQGIERYDKYIFVAGMPSGSSVTGHPGGMHRLNYEALECNE
jgi:hypothetical protein